MKNLIKFMGICLLCLSGSARAAGEFLPSNILLMDNKFAHHVLLVEKQTHKLHLFENSGSTPHLIKSYSTLTGKFKGDKLFDGDNKTPEGVYDINEFLSKEALQHRYGNYAKIYGSGAFPLNYPNFIDEREKKKGSGIWLHSTDDDNRIAKELDSRGCVVVQDKDLKDISQYVELNHTPVIVVQDIAYLSKDTWERNRKDISDAVTNWSKAWQEKNFDKYISSYDSENFFDKTKGNYSSYKSYKKAVFSRPDKPTINFSSMAIMASSNYAVVYLQQDYHSTSINDTGNKTLYLQKNSEYEWKIVGELFSNSKPEQTAFMPANNFFKDEATPQSPRN